MLRRTIYSISICAVQGEDNEDAYYDLEETFSITTRRNETQV